MTLLQRLNSRLEAALPAAPLRRWLVTMILLASMPLAILMSLQIVFDVRARQGQIEAGLVRAASALAQTVETEITSSFDALSVLARTEPLREGPREAATTLLRSRAFPRRDWHSVFLLDHDGRMLVDSTAAAGGPAGARLEALRRRVVEQGTPAAALLPRSVGVPRGIALAVPVPTEDGPPRVLGARIGAPVWMRLLASVEVPEGSHALLHNPERRLVVPDESPPQVALSGAAMDATQHRPSGVHRASTDDGRMVYAAWHHVPSTGWTARVVLPAAPIDAAHRSAIITALAASGGSLLLGLLLASLLAGRITRPLHELAQGGYQRVRGRQPVAEIAMLRDALQEAAERDEAARSRLEATAQEFEILFQNSPVPTAVALDAQCRDVRYNAAMHALFGEPGSGPKLQVLESGKPLSEHQWPLRRAASRGETVHAQELEIRTDPDRTVPVIVNAVPLRGPDGQPRGAISVLVDITERKRAEAQLLAADQELREHQGLMDLAQETGHVGFLHYRFADDNLEWTPGQCRLFALHAAPHDGLQGWFSRIDAADRARVEREFWTACALRRQRQTLDYAVPRERGNPRWLSSRMVLRYDRDGRATEMLVVTVDMTEQKDAEREQTLLTEREVALRQQAEAASRAKDEFLTMLSHELRNPLGAISAAVDVMEVAPADSSNAAEARSIVARQTRNLAHMMNDLLDVGRAIAGKIVLAVQPVNLATVATRVVQALSLTGEASRHDLRLRLEEAWVEGDPVRLEQVATNLLTNALRYTPEGGRVEVIVQNAGGACILEVRDTGPGIPASLLPFIFDLFVQGERTLDRRAGGLGIGLTLVRRLVELHHGTVSAESSGEGSRFVVRLPATPAPESAANHRLPRLRRRSVLLIEDNEDVRTALRTKLELDGHVVSTASNGVDGLARLLQLRPEVAIVDIGLPGLTGLELARSARAAGYGGRMIALSGYGHERDVKKAMVAGFDAYLVKPVDRDELLASLHQD